MNRAGYVDVLGPLRTHQGHPLYPIACSKVLTEKRIGGAHAALNKAHNIAEMMQDSMLERRLK